MQNQSAALGADYVVNASLLTDLRLGFFSYHVSENKFSGGTPATAAGIPNLNTLPDTSGLPSFNVSDSSISNFGNQNCNCPLLESEQVFQLNNNWTKVIGNHTIKFGGDIRYALNLRNASDNNRTGVLNFNSGASAGPNGAGSGLASLLFGDVNEFQRFDVYQNDAANRQKRLAFYGQDSYRATQKLTVNYGVRWDIIYPETVNNTANGGFASLVSGGTRVVGVAGIGSNGNEKMDYLNLAGRLGFAYQVLPNTVVRGGIGQVYDTVGYFGTLFGSVLDPQPAGPCQRRHQLPATPIGKFSTTLAAPPLRPAAPTIPANGIIPLSNNFNPQFRPERIQLPKVDQWNVAVQQQFGENTTFEIAYVGNHAERIYPGETYGYDLNAPVLPSSPAEIASGDIATRRPFFNKFNAIYNGAPAICCSNGMTSAAPSANARYNALQTKLDKRFAHGLQFNANYTWSKALGYANDNVFARYPRVSFGPNDTNREHLFVISGVYQLPFGKNRMFLSNSSRLMDYLVGGYSLSGASTWQSGARFTPTYAECGLDQDLDNNFNGPGRSSDCRPNKGSGAFVLHAGSFNPVTRSVQYFTPSTTPVGTGSSPFGRPAFATFGNIGRNAFAGPRQYMADAALLKDIPITESVRGQFQFQVFNVFNHPALDLPNASGARCVDCSNGGVITNIDSNVRHAATSVRLPRGVLVRLFTSWGCRFACRQPLNLSVIFFMETGLRRTLCTIVPATRSDRFRMIKTSSKRLRICLLGIFFAPLADSLLAAAQRTLQPIPQFPLSDGPLIIRQAVQPQHPFTVTGSTGAILGLQNGNVELWALPTKVFSNLHLSAELDGYTVPIDLNAAAATIDVQPDHTTITYSHAAITVRQHMFVPAGDNNQAEGAFIFFEDRVHPPRSPHHLSRTCDGRGMARAFLRQTKRILACPSAAAGPLSSRRTTPRSSAWWECPMQHRGLWLPIRSVRKPYPCSSNSASIQRKISTTSFH